jgi:site-specific recombinase XerD
MGKAIPQGSAVYIRYLDHVLYRNTPEALENAAERETIGLLTQENKELQRIIDLANVREKVIISMLALAGFRIGTLVRLQYRHARRDLERMRIPIHVHVEAEITKGKYHDYDAFLGQEAAEYLRIYLETRRRGTSKIPPENIHEESPLIRNRQSKRPIRLTPAAIWKLIHDLYIKAGLIKVKTLGRRHDLRPHSIRKFFRTQMAALGVDRDYIEYMMGHTINTYHDIKMNGIEFLRGIYISSGLSIKPKMRINKIDALKEIIRAWGLNPEEILTKNALAEPHRTVVDRSQIEQNQIHQLSIALKQHLLNELRENPNEK